MKRYFPFMNKFYSFSFLPLNPDSCNAGNITLQIMNNTPHIPQLYLTLNADKDKFSTATLKYYPDRENFSNFAE